MLREKAAVPQPSPDAATTLAERKGVNRGDHRNRDWAAAVDEALARLGCLRSGSPVGGADPNSGRVADEDRRALLETVNAMRAEWDLLEAVADAARIVTDANQRGVASPRMRSAMREAIKALDAARNATKEKPRE